MLSALMMPFASFAQSPGCGTLNLPFSETFDSTSTTRSCWTTVDGDGDGFGWSTLYNGADQGMMLSFSYDNDTWTPLTPNNWLISPKLHTVAGNDLTLQWTVAAGDQSYCAEHYGVYVSTTTTDTSAFVLVNQWTLTGSSSETKVLDLSAYAGQDIYVAFRHFNCTDMFVLMIDDVEVYEGAYVPDTLTVTFAVNDSTLGTTSPVPGTYQYITGDTVTFSAIPTGDSRFIGWEMTAGGETDTLGSNYIEASFLATNTMSYGSMTLTALFLPPVVCDPVALPYTETFEVTSDFAECWNFVSMNSANDVGTSHGMGFVTYNGSRAWRFSSYSNASDYNQYGFSPILSPSADAVNLSVSVDYATYGSNDKLNFGYITATDTVWDPTDYSSSSSSVWTTYTAIIPATATKLAVHYYGNYSFYAWIDNVSVTEMAGDYCYPVSTLTVDSATSTSIFLSWSDENNTGATYSIYGADGSVVATGITGTSYEITGLTALTAYTFGVAANCSATSTSSMTIIDAVTTCAGETCQVSIVGEDSYGDGWNGNAINVMQAGITIGTFTLGSGSYGTESYSVCAGAPVSFNWVSGLYSDEASFEILDGGLSSVYIGEGADMVDDSIFFTLANACPSCLPAAVTVDNVAETTVTLSWTGSAASYDIYLDGTLVTSTTANTYTFNGLNAATPYVIGVQAICDGNDSASMTIFSVTTSCADITMLPYIEGFEGGLGCWTTVNGSADGMPWTYVVDPSYAHSGSSAAASFSYYNYSPMHTNAWLISPKVVLPTTTDSIMLSWWHKVHAGYPSEHYDVVLSTTTADTAAFTTTLLSVDPDSTNNYVQKSVNLAAYAGQEVYIAFHHHNSYDQYFLFIDDIALNVGGIYVPDPDTLTLTFAVNDATMGSIVPAPGTYTYLSGDSISFAATPATGYEFDSWLVTTATDTLGYFTAASVTTTANYLVAFASEMTITALFEAAYVPEPDTLMVTFAVNNASMGTTIPAAGTYMYVTGDTVSFTAVPNAGYHFTEWTITYDGMTEELTDYVSAYAMMDMFIEYFGNEVTLTANFEVGNPDSTTITYAVNDASMGTIDPAPGTYTIYAGDDIEANAYANAGYHLDAWVLDIYLEGVLYSSDTIYSDDEEFENPMYFGILPQDFVDYGATITITALFAPGGSVDPDMVNITFTVNDASMGSISPMGTRFYHVGDTLTVTATPFAGYRLAAWQLTLDGETETLSGEATETYTEEVVAEIDGLIITAVFERETGIDDVNDVDFKVYSVDSRIVVRGVENKDVNIYDVTGRVVYNEAKAAETVEFTVPSAGVYMVKAGDAPAKRVVVVR